MAKNIYNFRKFLSYQVPIPFRFMHRKFCPNWGAKNMAVCHLLARPTDVISDAPVRLAPPASNATA
jgi:hypothetical protein